MTKHIDKETEIGFLVFITFVSATAVASPLMNLVISVLCTARAIYIRYRTS